MRTRLLVFPLLLAMVGTLPLGCRNAGPDPRSRPAGEIVAEAVAGRGALRSLASTGTMRVMDWKRNFALFVDTEIAAQAQPANLRIVATKLSGGIQAFDVLMMDEDVAFHVPRKQELYVGKISDLANTGVQFHPNEILHRLVSHNPRFAQMQWRHPRHRVIFAGMRPIEIIQVHDEGQPYLRLYIHRSTGDLLQVEHVNGKDEVHLKEEYEVYQPLALPGGTTVRFPYKIKLVWPIDNRWLRIRFAEVRPDETIDAGVWDLAGVGPNTTRKSLAEVRVDGDDFEQARSDADEAASP